MMLPRKILQSARSFLPHGLNYPSLTSDKKTALLSFHRAAVLNGLSIIDVVHCHNVIKAI